MKKENGKNFCLLSVIFYLPSVIGLRSLRQRFFRRTSLRFRALVFLCPCALVLLSGCETIPIVGRSQLSFIPASQLVVMSNNSFSNLLKESKLSQDSVKTATVERVGERIARATEQFLYENGQQSRVRDLDWEFKLIEDPENINAFAMPGGKVGIYSGIFKVVPDDASLATVMAHEIAHVIANHGGERMSQYLLVSLGGLTLDVALRKKESDTRKMWLIAYGLGSSVGYVLPYSRLQESEADYIGLILMAMAGYDPHAAIGLWERMNAESKNRMPAFLSTHPTPRARIVEIRARIPEAMKYYKSNP